MGSVFGKVTDERPSHTTVLEPEVAGFEVRCYDRLLAAQVVCKDGERGFHALARYIAENSVRSREGGARFDGATVPLHSENEPHPSPFVLQRVYLPFKFKALAELPRPTSDDISLVALEPACYAVKTFSGPSWGDNVRDHETALRAAVQREFAGGVADPQTKLWRYNAPWCLSFYRTNEVALRLTSQAVSAAAALRTLHVAAQTHAAAANSKPQP